MRKARYKIVNALWLQSRIQKVERWTGIHQQKIQNDQTTVAELWTDQFSFKMTFNLTVKTHVYTLTIFL